VSLLDDAKSLAQRTWACPGHSKNPDLVATPEYAAISAAWFWKKHGLNELADDQRCQALSLKINKKLDSFPEREAKRKRALDALSRGILVNLAMSLRMGGFGSWF
jgi:predicted chitinase